MGAGTRLRRLAVWIGVLAALAGGVSACGSDDAYGDSNIDAKPYKEIRKYTDRYKEFRVALGDHYSSGFVCASGDLPPDQGAAGVHLGNYALIRDHDIIPEKPEILIYMPTETDYKLVAVEWVVPDYGQKKPPKLFGQEFHRVDATDIPGFKLSLPPGEPPYAYYLHAWLYEENPRGMFADGNPNLRCGAPPPVFSLPPPAVGGAGSGLLPADSGPAYGDFLHLTISAGVDPQFGVVGRFDINHLNSKTGMVNTKLHGRPTCIRVDGYTAYVTSVITWGKIAARPGFDPSGHKMSVTISRDERGQQTFAIDLDFLPPAHEIKDCQPVTTDVVKVTDGTFVVK